MRIQSIYSLATALVGISHITAQVVNRDVITCAIKDASVGIVCPRDSSLLPDETCCRYHDNCGPLPKCTTNNCCGTRANKALINRALILDSGYSYDGGNPKVITCEIKQNSGSWKCGGNEPIYADKVCCRWSNDCGTLPKCRRPFCCKDYVFSPELEPSPSAVPEPDVDYEPVNHNINCGMKFLEDDMACGPRQILDEEKECCRFKGQCDDGVPMCTKQECCERDADVNPSASPSRSPEPTFYETTCGDRDGIKCDSGDVLLRNKECCEFEDFCDSKAGSFPHCSITMCCEALVPKPNLSPSPQPAAGGFFKVCECKNGAALKGECYSSLSKATDVARDGDTIYITGEVTVSSPVQFSNNLDFIGVNCGNKQPVLVAGFNSKTNAILEPTHKSKQKVTIENVAFTGMPNKKSAAFHALGSEFSSGNQSIDLTLLNVQIYDMLSERPGVGVFIGKSSNLFIDESCVFKNLRMISNIKGRYAGGAALAVIFVPEGSEMVVNGLFLENEARYPKSSRHAGGGAVYLDWVAGNVEFRAAFTENVANQGGAIHIQDVVGKVIMSGRFKSNKAIDDGYGARSGAFRVLKQHVGSEIELSGHFEGNRAQGRSGVMASNVMPKGCSLTFSGTFLNNVASHRGGVWSAWTSTVVAGKIVFDSKAKFEGNQSGQDDDESSIYDIAGEGARTLSEAEWKGRTVTIN
ncbi:hypothetical protein SARC_09111 [Sphaeroforma arctica JP610]|uniref:Right handed beta helix domain-containing protein n=1 Tax=Sphaeroforma arctica JP610 TaxID=667725 RepID=A0A0L0FNZ5_9EUKA|nr:hypothetical protein SARC_09111 [Sphaeroforma arctica JP610]KNC78459.1 hypothetical protein SARC_09111 [Sphaeroforma arctica JP610]|eukprot:XP_014152361.1 hypothetical protein SARC_09111 [Sphaeroforma arctica JP610]